MDREPAGPPAGSIIDDHQSRNALRRSPSIPGGRLRSDQPLGGCPPRIDHMCPYVHGAA
jgi:hypothetical protein